MHAFPPALRALGWLLVPAGVIAACARSGDSGVRCDLPAVSGIHRAVDNTAVFRLPDTGGFVVNGQVVPRARVRPLLRELFAPRAPSARAVFVWRPAAAARCADVAFVAAAARAAGGAAYDAGRSGWPSEIPINTGREP